MNPMKPNEVKQAMLTRLRFGISEPIEEKYLMDYGEHVEFDVRNLVDGMKATLSKAIYGQRAKQEVIKTVKVPATWTDHLRERLGLKFKTKEIEVKFKLDVYALFPKLIGTEPIIKIDI